LPIELLKFSKIYKTGKLKTFNRSLIPVLKRQKTDNNNLPCKIIYDIPLFVDRIGKQ
jgi:hypothetical protein